MNFKTFTGAAAVAATLAISATAHAATVLTWTNGNAGVTKSLDFNGKDGNSLVSGLTANIDYKLNSVSNSGKTWTFSYNVENTSDWPTYNANVVGFGFNVDPNVSSVSSSGEFNKASTGGSVSGLGTREVCFGTSSYSNNCSATLLSGVGIDDNGLGTFTLTFGSSKTSVSLSDFYVRYTSVYSYPNEWGGSAVGTALTPVTGPAGGVPEPATWAMMLIGFFAIGSTLRARRLALA